MIQHRYALILAGGSGLRLWPMSRARLPKQLIPLSGGRSLLQLAAERARGLVPPTNLYVCAGQQHRDAILNAIAGLTEQQFVGEPLGRDTLAAVGLSAALIARRDPEAVIAVYAADQLIEPIAEFERIVGRGYELVEQHNHTLLTFGIEPERAETGYGYLELDAAFDGGASLVREFREKPDAERAAAYFAAGPEKYLWNSGMFVWRASTILDCIRRYQPLVFDKLMPIAETWDTPCRDEICAATYGTLQKVSIDYAVLEPASKDTLVRVVALPMRLKWLDVGSWPSFGKSTPADADGNVLTGALSLSQDTHNTLIVSDDPCHLIAAVGCDGLIIVHTADATLVCHASHAETIKALHARIREKFGEQYI